MLRSTRGREAPCSERQKREKNDSGGLGRRRGQRSAPFRDAIDSEKCPARKQCWRKRETGKASGGEQASHKNNVKRKIIVIDSKLGAKLRF